MSGESYIEDIRKELEEVRRLKESLKAEIDELRAASASVRTRTTTSNRRIVIEPPRIDLSGLTESLEEMMEGLGEQIRESLKGIKGLDGELLKSRFFSAPPQRSWRSSEIEGIPPERVARVIAPLGSEERLRILDYLKEGGKTFNELEHYTGKTGSSLTHHLTPLIDAGYVIKGEVRGTYYVTVEGRLAYRLSQWLTSRLERETQRKTGKEPDEPEVFRSDYEDKEGFRHWLD